MIGKLRNIVFILTLLLLLAGFSGANAEVSFNVGLGSGDYYQPVGDYDYLPYAYQTNPGYTAPRINFHDMMSQYEVVDDTPGDDPLGWRGKNGVGEPDDPL